MNVVELINSRREEWKKLEQDIEWIRSKSNRSLEGYQLTRFAQRYRAVCSDLSLGISMGFPAETIRYLHQLVADGHAMLYRSKTFRIMDWGKTLFVNVPRRIVTDPCTWIAMFCFWGLFVGSMIGAMILDDFSVNIVGEETLAQMESMHSEPVGTHSDPDSRSFMTGFYVFNNAGIGLRCFACGIFLGVGSLVILAFNAIFLGSIFGHMLLSPQSDNFITFVTAHGPFELTAVALSAAAGLRLGWSILDTRGWTRSDSLRRSASDALELALTATVLFMIAAVIEGNVSPLEIPYLSKLLVAILSTIILLIWFIMPYVFYSNATEENVPHEA